MDPLSISVENGKYTFQTAKDDYRIHVLRYGEPWLVIDEGSKAVLALMQAVRALEEKLHIPDHKD